MKRNGLLLLFITLFMTWSLNSNGQCANPVISNGGFEQGMTDWWNWHDNSPDAYSFTISSDAFMGDSSAAINVLVDTDSIPGGQGGEYNSRPQTNPVTGGEFYEISFAAKSTVPNATAIIYIKDENDGWVLLHSETFGIDTTWSIYSSLWQADVNRADIHLELKVYNADIHTPYTVLFDEVDICETVITTNTCEDNIVTNPGFENGAFTDWWNWHGGEASDYSFETGTVGYVGDSSALIRVLKSSDMLTGAGEYNSRPQTQPIADSQNYEVTFWGISTEPNTEVQIWIKDENDGWTTIHSENVLLDTVWTEVSSIFTADQDRADIHLELKVFNAGFTAPYDVWFDEVGICSTDDEPGGTDPEPGPGPVYGTMEAIAVCDTNLVPDNDGFEAPLDLSGWDIWDGSSDSVAQASINLDLILPYSGLNSVRLDVIADHDIAEFHHRFGGHVNLTKDTEYTLDMWIRSNLAVGDTVRILARLVRDTDWTAQTFVDLMVVSDEWLNFQHSFTADADWDNAFVELKAFRHNGFTGAYSLWYDEISVCSAEDATFTNGIQELENLDLKFKLMPNPVIASTPATVEIESPVHLGDVDFTVFDMLGRTVWSKTQNVNIGLQDIQIPTHGLNSGVYMIHIEHNGLVKNLKLQVLK